MSFILCYFLISLFENFMRDPVTVIESIRNLAELHIMENHQCKHERNLEIS